MRMFFVVFALFLTSINSYAAGKVALVIGNGAYVNATPLPNPTNDSTDMTAALEALGFTVFGGNDLDYATMGAKIGEFEEAARTADVTLLFYAGHGLQVNGRNYMVPINAKLERESSLQFEAIDVETVLVTMSGPGKTAIALLDACRDNPLSRTLARSFGASRSALIGKGLAVPAISGGGMLIGFATAPGDVALDGVGRNSPFTTALLKNINTPGLEIQQLMTRVKGEVFSLTKENQEPWHNSSLRTEVYLVAPVEGGAVSTGDAASISAVASASAEWAAVQSTRSVAVLDAFIKKHSQEALYVALAEERKSSLAAAQVAVVDEPTPSQAVEEPPTAAPEGDSPPEASANIDLFLGEVMDIVNGTDETAGGFPGLNLKKPAAAPGAKTAKLNLKRIVTGPFAGLRAKFPELDPSFEHFAVCRSDFLDKGCDFMEKSFSDALVSALQQRGMMEKDSPVFRVVQISGSKNVLFTSSPKSGDGEVTMAAGVITPDLTVTSSFLIDISRSNLGIDAGTSETRFEITGALLEDGDIYLTIDSGFRCKDKKPVPRNVGILLRASLAELKVKWVSPFNVSNVNMASDGVNLYTGTVGSCAASHIYSIDKSTGEVNGRFKLPNGADKLMLQDDRLLVQHYPSASVYSFDAGN